ncbi:AbrB/MazE/SpoVT family DNA-binding domain-containing protein [Virgibacillus oceani]
MNEKRFRGREDTMETTLKKQGNSSAVIIRSEWKKALNIENGSPLEVTVDYANQSLIIKPKKVTRKKYSLDELVAEAKTQYPPGEIQTGSVGDEQF